MLKIIEFNDSQHTNNLDIRFADSTDVAVFDPYITMPGNFRKSLVWLRWRQSQLFACSPLGNCFAVHLSSACNCRSVIAVRPPSPTTTTVPSASNGISDKMRILVNSGARQLLLEGSSKTILLDAVSKRLGGLLMPACPQLVSRNTCRVLNSRATFAEVFLFTFFKL